MFRTVDILVTRCCFPMLISSSHILTGGSKESYTLSNLLPACRPPPRKPGLEGPVSGIVAHEPWRIWFSSAEYSIAEPCVSMWWTRCKSISGMVLHVVSVLCGKRVNCLSRSTVFILENHESMLAPSHLSIPCQSRRTHASWVVDPSRYAATALARDVKRARANQLLFGHPIREGRTVASSVPGCCRNNQRLYVQAICR